MEQKSCISKHHKNNKILIRLQDNLKISRKTTLPPFHNIASVLTLRYFQIKISKTLSIHINFWFFEFENISNRLWEHIWFYILEGRKYNELFYTPCFLKHNIMSSISAGRPKFLNPNISNITIAPKDSITAQDNILSVAQKRASFAKFTNNC